MHVPVVPATYRADTTPALEAVAEGTAAASDDMLHVSATLGQLQVVTAKWQDMVQWLASLNEDMQQLLAAE